MHLNALRQTVRRLLKNRGFSASVVLTLGLGIAATVSVFSIIDAVLIRPLPYPNPSQLFRVFQSKAPNDQSQIDNFSPANFLDFRAQNRSFADLAASCGFNYNLTANGEAKHLSGIAISAGLFDILGVQPTLGRSFLPAEDSYSSPHVVLLSNALWSGEFHGDQQIVGRVVSLNGDPYTVVGVMPRGFRSPDGEDPALWVPLQQQIRPDRMLWRDQHFLQVIGRLRPGVTIDQARADLNRISAQLHNQYPATDNGPGAAVIPLQESLVGDSRTSLLLSFGIVVFVLLIASGNVGILTLARVTGRTRELAIRSALGASARQVLSDLVVESVILGLLGGSLGIALALAASKLVLHFAPSYGVFALVQINPEVLAFAVAVSVLVGFGLGLIPGATVLRCNLQDVLKSSGSAQATGSRHRIPRNILIVSEISLAFVLLIATGLLLRSLINLQHQPLGFRAEGVLTAKIALPRIHYQNNDDVINFFTRVGQNLRNLPGIDAVGIGYPLPIQGNEFWTSFTIPGRAQPANEYESASLRFIDSGFLRAIGIPLLDGRDIVDADDKNREAVALVSASFARQYWPYETAIGRYITIDRDPPVPRRIVGIVGDVRASMEDDPLPTMYVSYKQMSFPTMAIVLQTRQSSIPLQQIRQAVQSVDPYQPLDDLESMTAIIHRSLEPWRFALWLLGGLASLAIVLTAIGLFAVLSYLVGERTKELGVRMAVGASRANIIGIVLTQSLTLTLWGIAIGISLAFVCVRLMQTTVYNIQPNDPQIFTAVAISVAITALAAAYLPARRAAAIEPLAALREE